MKILGSDYDGTLTAGGIGEEKLQLIRAWREAGHKFGIVSGRGIGFLTELKQKHPTLELDFLAACNGGYITDGEGALWYRAECRDVSPRELCTDLLAFGCPYAHVMGDRYACAVADVGNLPKGAPEGTSVLPSELPTFDYITQVSVRLPTLEEAATVAERVRDSYGAYLTPLLNGKSIDIVPRGVNKAEGLLRVAEHLGASRADVIAVGDNINDADMIRAFHSYAMEKGVDEIKALADEIVSDVADLIRKEM